MKHRLMELPYWEGALEPYISTETIQYHYGKHHAGYVKKLNALIKGTAYEDLALEEIIKTAEGGIFNNASQIYNHDFYFQGLSIESNGISEILKQALKHDFGSLQEFKEIFIQTATNLFGSGWVWLSMDTNGKLIIEAKSNADSPLIHNHIPLLTCDVWEHAYYIDYRNVRADYLEKWWNVINWDFVSKNFGNAKYIKFPCDENSGACA